MSLFYHMERLQAPHKVRMSPNIIDKYIMYLRSCNYRPRRQQRHWRSQSSEHWSLVSQFLRRPYKKCEPSVTRSLNNPWCF